MSGFPPNPQPLERPFALFTVGGKLALAHVWCSNAEGWRGQSIGRVYMDVRHEQSWSCTACYRWLNEAPAEEAR